MEAPKPDAPATPAKAPTYLELITATPAKKAPSPTPAPPAPEPPKAPKTKRERADENWKVLDTIISESEQFERGSEERSKCLEKLHQVLRQISKRPRTDSGGLRHDFGSATEEWDDFLAPSCEICGNFTDGTCKCDELEEHANSFLAPEEHAGESSKSVSPAEATTK
mmetsp:Transcript_64559/g.158914  ORF Transcript_64559/g.158914 Transcript_64559/m.158914 type:complete len:167 (-) Transcript_64559:853-1353(-)